MIMAVVMVNENCSPRKGFKLYLKYKLTTINLISFTVVGGNCVLVSETSGNLGLGNVYPLKRRSAM